MLRYAIDCFLTAGFIIGNMWVFGGRPASSCAPCLCRIVVVVLALSFLSWTMLVIVCAGIYCCIPRVLRAMRAEDDEDNDHNFAYIHNKLISKAGASEAAIHGLPFHTYFAHLPLSHSPPQEDSFIHSSTSRETKVMSCCAVCLASYEEGVQVRELPCTHRFHMKCVDKWLRISATCPLCKHEINQFAPEEICF